MRILIFGLALLVSVPLSVNVDAQDSTYSGNAAADKAGLKEYAARYEVDPTMVENYIFDITLENNDLWLKPSHIAKKKLIRKSGDSFLVADVDVPVKFNRGVTGRVTSFTVQSPMLFDGKIVTARKLDLAAPSLTGHTTFRLKGYPNAHLVAVAGTFNNWNQSEKFFALQGNEWICRLDLAPGTYQYKFIIDGDWITDPENSATEDDKSGNTNSILVVKP